VLLADSTLYSYSVEFTAAPSCWARLIISPLICVTSSDSSQTGITSI